MIRIGYTIVLICLLGLNGKSYFRDVDSLAGYQTGVDKCLKDSDLKDEHKCKIDTLVTFLNKDSFLKEHIDKSLAPALSGLNFSFMGLMAIQIFISLIISDNTGCAHASDTLINIAGLIQIIQGAVELFHSKKNFRKWSEQLREKLSSSSETDTQLIILDFFIKKKILEKSHLIGKISTDSTSLVILGVASILAGAEANQGLSLCQVPNKDSPTASLLRYPEKINDPPQNIRSRDSSTTTMRGPMDETIIDIEVRDRLEETIIDMDTGVVSVRNYNSPPPPAISYNPPATPINPYRRSLPKTSVKTPTETPLVLRDVKRKVVPNKKIQVREEDTNLFEGKEIVLGNEIGRGSYGTVYNLKSHEGKVVKIYQEGVWARKEKKTIDELFLRIDDSYKKYFLEADIRTFNGQKVLIKKEINGVDFKEYLINNPFDENMKMELTKLFKGLYKDAPTVYDLHLDNIRIEKGTNKIYIIDFETSLNVHPSFFWKNMRDDLNRNFGSSVTKPEYQNYMRFIDEISK